MKNKFLKLAGVAMTAAAFAGSAYANPIGLLTLSDGTTTVTALTDSSGLAVYAGLVGNWSINVTSALQNGDSTQPVLTLSSLDANFSGSTVGNVLTIAFTVAPVGPLGGTYLNNATGVLNGVTATFDVLLNGSPVSVPTGISSGDTTGATSIGIEAILTATTGRGFASISDTLSDPVPDGGTTVLLLGAALSGIGLLRKKMAA